MEHWKQYDLRLLMEANWATLGPKLQGKLAGPVMRREGEQAVGSSFMEAVRDYGSPGFSLAEHHLPRIIRCLKLLSDEDIWWRPNPSSNSIGNLVVHLSGNVKQWILSGLGDAQIRASEKGSLESEGHCRGTS